MTIEGFKKVSCGEFNQENFPIGDRIDKTLEKTNNIIKINGNDINYLIDNLDILNLVDGLCVDKIIKSGSNFLDNKKMIDNFISKEIDNGHFFKITNNKKHNISDRLPKVISVLMKNLQEDDFLEIYLFEMNNNEVDLYVGNHTGEIGKINNKYLSDISKFPKIKTLELDIDDILNYKMLKKGK